MDSFSKIPFATPLDFNVLRYNTESLHLMIVGASHAERVGINDDR
jgi:hypothetical protein